ncbi:MAG: hypothetical protein Roseis2KO_45680 [Roseivirga sp.]
MRQTFILTTLLWANLLFGQGGKWVEPSSIDTTMALSGITVSLSPGEEQPFATYLLPKNIIDSLTKGIHNSHKYSLAIERYQIIQFGQRFRRTDEGLFLKLNNGDWQLMKIDPLTDEVDNVFEHYFDKFGFYSIRVQWGEGNGYKLVNTETGTVTDIIGKPFFSPDGSKVIALGNDIEAGYSENGFELMENMAGKIKPIGRYNPGSWGCISALWLTNNTLLLQNQSLESKADAGWGYFSFYTRMKLN